MSEKHAASYIHTEKRNTRSVDEQVAISHAMWHHDIGPAHDGLRAADIPDAFGLDLDYNIRTSLSHLVEIDAVEKVNPSGPEYFAISERLDDVINGRVDAVAAEDIEAIIEHIHDDDPTESDTTAVADGAGATLRSLLADEFDVMPSTLEQYLRTGDQVEKLNQTVQAIRDTDEIEKRETYDEIIFRRGAHRYRLTVEHVARYEQAGEQE